MAKTLRETISDEHLPQMGALVDAARMREVFADEVERRSKGRLRIDNCAVAGAKYRPGRNCLVTYRLEVVEESTGARDARTMVGLGCGAGESRALYLAEAERREGTTWIGDAVIHLPQLETVVWIFPHDRKLGGLPALVSGTITGPYWGMIRGEVSVIRYVAERSCTVRVSCRPAGAGEDRERVFFAKTYCEGESEGAWRRQLMVWESAARKSNELLIAQPLACESETIWQAGLEGRALAEEGGAELGERLEAAGAAVAALHGSEIGPLPEVDMDEIARRMMGTGDLIARVRAEREVEVRRVVEGLLESAPQSGEGRRATLHGDLHAGNMLSISSGVGMTGRVALLDLDNLSRGDPHQDLGSFCAALYERALRGGGRIEQCEEVAGRLADRFIDGYSAGSDGELSRERLEWWTAAALIYERAWRLMTKMKPVRMEMLDDLIALAGRRLRAGGME